MTPDQLRELIEKDDTQDWWVWRETFLHKVGPLLLELWEAAEKHLERDATEDHWAVQSRHREIRQALTALEKA